MKTAILYIRVSTDEQADKGYSQRSQQEALERHCEKSGIEVNQIIFEDHSAKTFDRPAWTTMLNRLRETKKARPDYILFTKWDRFSRNAGDAYAMLTTLRRLGVEPQASEQPLDLSVPENKMMLAIYLAAPEVENDRRALNVLHGMRRARKEGRWMGAAPIGYRNKVSEDGRKYISPKQPEAGIMRWVFEELANGVYAADQVRKMANARGLKCERNNFWKVIRNPVYCGKITIPAYGGEEAMTVKGQHEPIISESLFYEVQDVLDGRKRPQGTKVCSQEEMPLRGFLNCPKCTKALTGSASRGRSGYYYYYHCSSACGIRFKAELVNSAFERELSGFRLYQGAAELFRMVIKDAYASRGIETRDERKSIIEQIGEQERLVSAARRRLLLEEIEADDFREIKAECKEKLARLEARLSELPAKSKPAKSIDSLLENVLYTFSNLDVLYRGARVEEKRRLIGSIFPEKLVFDGERHRTGRVNEAAELMFLINRELRQKKKGKKSGILNSSPLVVRRGTKLANINQHLQRKPA